MMHSENTNEISPEQMSAASRAVSGLMNGAAAAIREGRSSMFVLTIHKGVAEGCLEIPRESPPAELKEWLPMLEAIRIATTRSGSMS